ncbi:MAG: winged helix-turn-helix transcriptional regulator [Clostridium sp.]|uniref:winged helix-turn-helix transcriptional regulator n=1 Tax=Clostridium sp. TaxID=1506 RepID=UPI003EE74E84
MINFKDKNYVCLLDLGFEIIRGKWKSVIICHLSKESLRFLELQRLTSGVSQKVLTEKLKELEDDEIIYRIVYPQVPPKVEYTLTEKGFELSKAINLIEDWSIKYYKDKI